MKSVIIGFFLLISSSLLAQDIEIKGMKQVKATAEAAARKDINGINCGLVRVKMSEEGAQFTGNIVGNVEYVKGEYLVYMAVNSKRLNIKHPNYLPVTIVFSDFNIKKIQSNTEYQMETKLHKEKQKRNPKKKGIAVFNVNPTSAVLAIDGEPLPVDISGSYTVNIPYGTHYFSTTYDNFTIDNQFVHVDKLPKQITVDLTEYCPWLIIDCSDDDAEIYTNDTYRGEGKWEGLVAPGEYVIQARKDGCRTLSQTIMLQENQTFSAHFDNLKIISGSVKVEYEPIGSSVYLDGEKVGVTPLELNAVTPGKHKLRISKEFCTDETKNIFVSEDQTLNVKGSLPMTFWAVLLNEAEKGNGCAMLYLADMYSTAYGYGAGFEWGACDVCYERFCELSKSRFIGIEEKSYYTDEEANKPNYEKAIYWLKRAQKAKPTHTQTSDDEWIITKESYNIYILYRLIECYARLHKYSESFSLSMKCYKEYNKGELSLAWHYYFGKGVQRDFRESFSLAMEYYKKYNDYDIYYDSRRVFVLLAMHYYYGNGVQRDISRARELFPDIDSMDNDGGDCPPFDSISLFVKK